jgi:arginyl-tRNA synthetase
MLDLYVRVSSEAKTNPALEDQARAEFKKLEDGDAENRKLWEWFKDESLIEFHKMFKRLGVKFDLEIGESFYEEAIYDVIKELEQKELLIPGEEGSKIVNLDAQKLPVALIQKSDGASLYITRDIASMKHRLSRYKPAKLLYVVANQQALHFEQLFAITDLLGLKSAEKKHVKFGMVLGEDGKKFATREGKLIKLEDLLDQAVAGAYKVVAEKNKDLSEGEKQAVAEAVGIGAIKYNDLKENRNSDIVFNWEQMLDLHGDTAPYLQYTAVRLASIARKVDVKPSSDFSAVNDELKSGLVKKILDFNDVVSFCAETYYTSHLAKYLFELAKLGNQYYETHRILEDENKARQAGRLALLTSVSETIKKGLGLLGIAVPERI